MSERAAPAEPLTSEYDTYDDFLKGAIRAYYEKGFSQRKGNFIALVIASGQALSLAKDSLSGEEGLKQLAVLEYPRLSYQACPRSRWNLQRSARPRKPRHTRALSLPPRRGVKLAHRQAG